MKKFKSILASLFLAGIFATPMAQADGVMMEMFQMKKELSALQQAETSEQFQQASQQFIAVAEKAKATMPNSLDGDQAQFKGYQQAMQELIDSVQKAQDLAKQGKLEEAKALNQSILEMKKKYHQQYK